MAFKQLALASGFSSKAVDPVRDISISLSHVLRYRKAPCRRIGETWQGCGVQKVLLATSLRYFKAITGESLIVK